MTRTLFVVFFCFISLASPIYSQQNYDIPRLSPKVKTLPDVRNPVISLNGTWDFYSASIPVSSIEVPGEWTMQGFYVPDE
ncbi:MAG: hypothetical protein LBC74_11860 [Planctomycetaceae bacterium]|jgi:hypothetical protein|nr:hypothetical protein [Planctomycetaceae bacterium]